MIVIKIVPSLAHITKLIYHSHQATHELAMNRNKRFSTSKNEASIEPEDENAHNISISAADSNQFDLPVQTQINENPLNENMIIEVEQKKGKKQNKSPSLRDDQSLSGDPSLSEWSENEVLVRLGRPSKKVTKRAYQDHSVGVESYEDLPLMIKRLEKLAIEDATGAAGEAKPNDETTSTQPSTKMEKKKGHKRRRKKKEAVCPTPRDTAMDENDFIKMLQDDHQIVDIEPVEEENHLHPAEGIAMPPNLSADEETIKTQLYSIKVKRPKEVSLLENPSDTSIMRAKKTRQKQTSGTAVAWGSSISSLLI